MPAIDPALASFIKQRVGEAVIPLAPSSPIEQTLELASLETIMFYQDFVKHFAIQVPKDWDISNHVSPDVFHNWRHSIKRLFSKSYRDRTKYVDLTVEDLQAMIETRMWKDPESIRKI